MTLQILVMDEYIGVEGLKVVCEREHKMGHVDIVQTLDGLTQSLQQTQHDLLVIEPHLCLDRKEELQQTLRQQVDGGTPVIVLTTLPRPILTEEGFYERAHYTLYLLKPLSPEDVLLCVNELIGR